MYFTFSFVNKLLNFALLIRCIYIKATTGSSTPLLENYLSLGVQSTQETSRCFPWWFNQIHYIQCIIILCNNVKTKVLFPQAAVILTDFGNPIQALWFPASREHLRSPRFLVGLVFNTRFQFYVYVLEIVVCPFFFWSLYCLSFFDLRILITPLVSSIYGF